MERRSFIKGAAIVAGGLLVSENLLNAAGGNMNKSGKPIIVIHGGAGKIKIDDKQWQVKKKVLALSLIHISEPTRPHD